MVFLLALLLIVASVRDIQTRRIPNCLCAAGVLAGLVGHVWHDGWPGFLMSLSGIAAALPLLLLYAVGALGAGDVKLLIAVGALTGPHFLLWTLLGAIFAGAALALLWIVRRSVLRLSPVTLKARMPFAPAIALGAAWAFVHLHLRPL